MIKTFEELLIEALRRGSAKEQALSFAYGNLAMTTNHKPSRKAFIELAISRYGWTREEAELWAGKRTWEVE